MMDLLTDLLQQAGVRRRLLDQRHLGPDAALQFPCERSIGLHVVTQGRVWLHAPTLDAPLPLSAGDIAVMARGCVHQMATGPEPHAAPSPVLHDAPPVGAPPADAAAVISGAYQLWNTPLHPFFREMPPWFVLRADSLPRLGPLALLAGLLQQEVQSRELGADTVVHGLLDVIFTMALREITHRQGGTDAPAATWARAVHDLPVRQALAAMQADCAHPWTLDDLAQRAGLSRTALAERFRVAMGDTPLSHLRALRMQKAMRLLADTDLTLEQVARDVGYQDAFGFSKVFKRAVGLAPREFRRQERASRTEPWRFQAG